MCRELTKLHEEVLRGTAAGVLSQLGDPVRGEIVVVLEAQGETRGMGPIARGRGAGSTGAGLGAGRDSRERVERALAELIDSGVGTKSAARVIADLTGLSTRETYALALKAKERE